MGEGALLVLFSGRRAVALRGKVEVATTTVRFWGRFQSVARMDRTVRCAEGKLCSTSEMETGKTTLFTAGRIIFPPPNLLQIVVILIWTDSEKQTWGGAQIVVAQRDGVEERRVASDAAATATKARRNAQNHSA